MLHKRLISLLLAIVFVLPDFLVYGQPALAEATKGNQTSQVQEDKDSKEKESKESKEKEDDKDAKEKKPKLTALSPARLALNQTTRITLTGTNLSNISQVQFDPSADIAARILYGTDTEKVIEVIVNPLATLGKRKVRVANPKGSSNPLDFDIIPPPPTAPATTLSGKVLSGDAIPKPLAGVRVSLEQFPGTGEAYTDATGAFTLRNLPERKTTILVDGRPISTAQVEYPAVIVPANILANQANKLAYTVYLTANDPQGKKTIPTTFAQDLTLTTPDNPGLQVKLPAGLKITRPDGTPVTQITITSLPPDRTPMPFPNGVSPVRLLSIQPADAILSQPVQVTYPNLSKNARPGTKVPLYRADHDTESGQYVRYGTGTVSANGQQIVPDIDPATGKPYGLPAFSWHFPIPPQPQNQGPGDPPKNQQGNGCSSGGSVDVASGTEKYQSTDIAVTGGQMPFGLTRTYRSGDNRQGPFGIGSAHNFELILQEIPPVDPAFLSPGTPVPPSQLVELVQSNNYRVKFPIVAGTTNQFANLDSPGHRGSTLTKNGSGYTLKMKNGGTMTFGVSSTIGGGKVNYFLTSLTDRNGNTFNITRDAGRNVTEISSVSGKLTLAVDLNTGRVQKITDQGGRSVSYQYDAAGRLITVTDPLGQTISYTYDANNQLLTTTNMRGIVDTRRTYDANGRIIQEQYADNSEQKFIYTLINSTDPLSGIASTDVVDAKGHTQTYRVDAGLYSCSVSDSFGKQNTVEREPGTNRVRSIVDRLGRVTSPVYDARENLTQVTAPDGSINKVAYEPNFNLVTAITNPLGQTSTITYDSKGNPTEIKDPLGKISKLVYDQTGQATSVTNSLNQTTQMVYDARGNIIKAIDPLGNSATFTYDLLNRLTKATDALGHVIQYQYDLLDRVTQSTSSEGRVTKSTYDANSNLVSVTDPGGNVTRYDYDNLDRLAQYTDPSGKIETYQYDVVGNITKYTDRKGQATTYNYDANDRLVSTTYADGAIVSNTYDDADRPIALNDTASGAGKHTFSYDQVDQLTQESNPRGTVSYTYDLLGRRTSLKINGGRTLNYSYDSNNRLNAISEGSETFSFSYDQLDRRAGMTLPNGVSAAYSYDAAGRLTGIKYTKGSTVLRDLTYTYDELGRRTSASGNPAPEPRDTATDTATVNALNQYTTLNGKTLAYDANGNQSFKNAVWDARDRLVSLSGPNLTASFTYDAFDRRTSKTVNGQTKTYHYDGADLISETGAEYTFGPGIDEPLKRKSGQNEYYLSDALGSVIGLADSNGAVKTSYNYSPFGKKQSTGASSDNPFTFTGREDDGTGLYYYRARYYSPDQKRFIAADPLGFGGGDSNFYAYVGNNPINFTDPTGESFESFAQGLAVGGASGVVSSFVITAAVTASGVTIGPLIAAVLYLGGGAALIAAINEIANEPCPDKRDYLLGALIGGAVGGGLGAKLGGGLGAGLRQGRSPYINPKSVAGKSPSEIDQLARKKGLTPKGSDPMSGKGAYIDPVTGKQRVLIHPDASCGPHCHVNNPAGERLNINGQVVPPESPAAHLPLSWP
jgi:RHS repeat-associated protein